MTSLCKVYGSEAGPKAADLGMQVMGGYGYLTGYGMEQIWRDARICAIYEGTTGIHTKGLATRGLRPGGGADAFEALVLRLADGAPDAGLLTSWQAMRDTLRAADDPAPKAHAFYKASAALLTNAIWQKLRRVADHHADAARIKSLAARVLDGGALP